MLNFNSLFGPADRPSRPIPRALLAPEVAEAGVRETGAGVEVALTLAMPVAVLGHGENCCVGLALDASISMAPFYGRGSYVPDEVCERFIRAGQYREVVRDDGMRQPVPSPEALAEIKRLGLARPRPNLVEDPARQLLAGLIETFAAGKAGRTCEVIYWACGSEGRQLEVLGRVGLDGLEDWPLRGPRVQGFGAGTFLAPALRYFLDQDPHSNGAYVLLTDGRIDDEEDVVDVTYQAARQVAEGQREAFRFVLVGVGPHVDAEQLARFAALDLPPDLAGYDPLRILPCDDLDDIANAWSRIVDPDTEVATRATAYDHQGRPVHSWTDGLRALLTFRLPRLGPFFELEIEGHRFRQALPPG